MKLIIGVTGPMGGGKGTVVDILREKGFFGTSLSDRIREEITRRGQKIIRERLQDVADELRRKFGPNVLAMRTWKLVMKQNKNAAIDSIRSFGEVVFFKEKPNFFLIGVTAPRELRYQRVKERIRDGEPLSYEEFSRLDEKDFKSGEGDEGRDIQECLDKADFLIENTGSLEELREKVDTLLKSIKRGGSR